MLWGKTTVKKKGPNRKKTKQSEKKVCLCPSMCISFPCLGMLPTALVAVALCSGVEQWGLEGMAFPCLALSSILIVSLTPP